MIPISQMGQVSPLFKVISQRMAETGSPQADGLGPLGSEPWSFPPELETFALCSVASQREEHPLSLGGGLVPAALPWGVPLTPAA